MPRPVEREIGELAFDPSGRPTAHRQAGLMYLRTVFAHSLSAQCFRLCKLAMKRHSPVLAHSVFAM